jgi:hypothetical protein
MRSLNTAANIAKQDDFYERLIDMHRELSPAQSNAANAALILLLANHIGDTEVLDQAMDIARNDALQAG